VQRLSHSLSIHHLAVAVAKGYDGLRNLIGALQGHELYTLTATVTIYSIVRQLRIQWQFLMFEAMVRVVDQSMASTCAFINSILPWPKLATPIRTGSTLHVY
jgi:hypothetical protein